MVRDFLELMSDELSALKRDGVTRVSVSETSLTALRNIAGAWAVPPSEKKSLPPTAPTPPATLPSAKSTAPVAEQDIVPPPTKKESSAKSAVTTAPLLPAPLQFEIPAGDKETQRAWLRDKVLNCPVCQAHVRPGKKIVFGVGAVDATIFFCGEAPGADEETQGEPFVGPAGQLLTKIIQAMGLSREQVYIGNIMNWRPEMPTAFGNRPPTSEEMAFCLPYLQAQVAIVKPKVIVALGATAIEGLLGHDPNRKIGAIHGKWHTFNGTPLMPTYHPSYLLRNGTNKSKRIVWEDMMLVMEKIGLPISEKQKSYFL